MGNMKISTRRWSPNLVFLLISSGFHWQFVDAFTDTILQGQSLTTSQTIISAGGNFELGFFSPGKSTKYYVGIWYKKFSEQTIVWVANRDYSFTNPSVVLTVSTDGNLEILEGKISYKVTSISSNSNTSATLLDSGNLVLKIRSQMSYGRALTIHRTLPAGMKLGYDKRAGKTWSLVSWKSAEDPSPGDFSLQIDPNGTSQIFACKDPTGFEPRFPEDWNLQDRSGGCVRKADLQCVNESHANGERDQFLLVSNVRLPKIWGGDLVNVEQLPDGDSNARSFYIKLAASELNKRVSSSKWKVWLIVTLAISLTSVFVNYGIWRRFRRKGEDLLVFDFGNSSEDTSYELDETNRLWRGEKREVDLPMFSFASVSASTNNFSIENKLGEGGFGSVYKELKNEAMLIAKLQHKNLVKVLGYCIERDEKILIYEYMSNKSLDFFLFDPTKHGILNWKTRVHIIEGVAQGLLYLHQYSRLRIIHRDLKASNILLDKDMNPKISDFGMARIFGGNESKATKHIVGTYGYMSPEYALEGLFSTKSDVFSFGVLLLEILSGKKNTGFYQTDCSIFLDIRGQELMDPGLEETLPTHILLRYINVGLLCVQESADDRPTMSDIVSMLGNESTHKSLSSNPDLEQYLTSWKCTDDPSTRNFTWRLDIPRLPQLAVGMGSVKKYRTGPWNGAGNYSANLRVTINHLGLLQWNILNESNDEWTTIVVLMAFAGFPACQSECLKGFTPNSKGEWEMFDWSSGCERAGTLDCKSKDDLMKVLGVKLPDLLEFWLNKSMSLKECEAECLKNCSCVAYANSNIKGGSSGCLTWYGDLIDIGGFTDGKSGQDLYIRCPAGELGLESEMEDLELPLFDLATIDTATNNFCVINRIGTGSFGPVFKIKTGERYCHGKSALTLLWGSCKDFGYTSPEYVIDCKSSVKSNVFSFGVLLLEIVACIKNRGFYHSNYHHNLLGHANMVALETRQGLGKISMIDTDATTGREELPSENVVTISVPEGCKTRLQLGPKEAKDQVAYTHKCGFCSDLS
ncbi:Receptor-like serine/threonine-protein kinase SD1-6 [Vitis vinifera]|uniref:non-specific serine/threonine protein kinase n=1 Tax=Vitis vinifera TaxID=29760 RepID=A0A438GDR0_VITVI|nr:Receptor-like serine/threonine-protein kinase SD1-6 [Vitis vinifera]